MNRNQREGRYQGAVTRFGNKWGDYRPNREGNTHGKRHIRSTVIPEEPMCNAFKGAKSVSAGAALNVLAARYKASKPVVQIGLGVDQFAQQLIDEMNSDVSTVRS